MITYMAAAGVGQADVNRIARRLQRIDDELSKNREEANERAGEKAEKLISKPKKTYLR
jgi:tetrahydromethanopterin S-methyltransferase subunit G